jgi:two-component system cell cycle response regulator
MNQKKKILIVEEESYRHLLKEMLRGKYTVFDTSESSEALLLAKVNQPDLIILDVEMSGNNGLELCQALKEEESLREVPILLTTSQTSIEEAIIGLKAGGSDFITKPLFLQAVVARIESHLRTQEDYAELGHKDLLMLLELLETISVTKNPTEILRLIVNKVSKIIDVTRCSVIGVNKGKKIVVKASSDLDKNREINLDISKYPEIRRSIETKQTVIVNDVKSDPLMASVQRYLDSVECNSIIVIPLIKKESVIGTFFLRTVSHLKGGISHRIYRLCQMVANIAANALENAILFESVKTAQEYFEAMAIQDDLTKTYNRIYFYQLLNKEVNRMDRYESPLSLIFFGVDDFKGINNTYGHAQGDKVLMQIGSLLKSFARKSDAPARFGGDEFALILPNTDAEGALKLANRLLLNIRNTTIEGLDGKSISTSVGVATCTSNTLSADDLVKLADDAMCQSKSLGKGRVSQA